jgi:hypothetical protein
MRWKTSPAYACGHIYGLYDCIIQIFFIMDFHILTLSLLVEVALITDDTCHANHELDVLRHYACTHYRICVRSEGAPQPG